MSCQRSNLVWPGQVFFLPAILSLLFDILGITSGDAQRTIFCVELEPWLGRYITSAISLAQFNMNKIIRVL